jgi:hypothetical protein
MSQIGSTEWAEENMDILGSRAIAYLNVDISVFGPGGLMPRATPQLDELIKEASKMVFKLYTYFFFFCKLGPIYKWSMQLHNHKSTMLFSNS